MTIQRFGRMGIEGRGIERRRERKENAPFRMTRKLVAEDRHAVDLPTSGEVALDLFWSRPVIHLFPPKSSSFLSALPV